MTKKILALMLLAGLLPAAAQAATQAGSVTLATGRATASDPTSGVVRQLAKGEPIYSGEIVSTGANTFINIRYQDGGFTLLRPNSRFEIADYQFNGESAAPAEPVAASPTPAELAPAVPEVTPKPAAPATSRVVNTAVQTGPSRAFFRLLKGGFRAVSGVIGKTTRAEYRVSTPVATIGIRGTDYEVDLCDAACAKDPTIRRSIQNRARALLDGLQLAELEAAGMILADASPDQQSGEGSEIVHVNEGTIDYTNEETQKTTVITEGEDKIMLPDGDSVPMDKQPDSLEKPDPEANECN